jgi:cysteinyl-tRNA synthetase
VNTLLNSGEEVGRAVLQAIDDLYRELGGQVLGLIPDEERGTDVDTRRQDGLIQLLIELRAEARRNKNYALADMIRIRLADLGITLEDRSDGTVYKIQ